MNHCVLICTPVLCVGGTEIQTLSLVQVLVGAGFIVNVCCYYEYDMSMVAEIQKCGAKVILMESHRSGGLLTLAIKLASLLKQVKPYILHVQYVAPGFIPIIAARLSGVKRVYATVHQPGRPYGLKSKLFIRIAACLCNGFFCNSKSVEKSWFGDSELFDPENINLGRKHFSIYNGVDVEKIERIVRQTDTCKLRESLNIGGKKVIGVVGRLRKEKGQVTLLKSMKMVIGKFRNTVLLVVGDGPDASYLKQMSEKFGVSGHVLWVGKKDPEEVHQLYSIMDVVAVPSLFEGFGLAAAEAMAAGRPLVASRVDGLIEVVKHGVNGYLVASNDISSFAANIIDLLSDPRKGKIMGECGQKIVREKFSLKGFQRSMLSAYRLFI